MKRKVLGLCMHAGMIVLVLHIGLHATVLPYKEIENESLFLQVGAFSKEANLQRALKRLHKFPLWIERGEGVNRLFVVLPKARNMRRSYLKKLKSIVPDAFIRRGYKPAENGIGSGMEVVPATGKPLDADAILRTRKKFF